MRWPLQALSAALGAGNGVNAADELPVSELESPKL